MLSLPKLENGNLKMETAAVKSRSKVGIRFLPDLSKHIGVQVKTVDAEALEDIYLAALMEKRLDSESVSYSEVMNVLRSNEY